MASQKIPLFNGLFQPCHDGIGAAEAVTTVFTPPDKTAKAGTQAFYLLHLWIKNTLVEKAEEYVLRAYRGSAMADKRLLWRSNAAILSQLVGPASAPVDVPSAVGVPVKILDGYPVRGDVIVELATTAAAADSFSLGEGTRIWGYYQRIGMDDNEPVRFIGEPPAGPAYDTGLPLKVSPGELVTLHTFEANRIDEISLQLAVEDDLINHAAAILSLAGADGVALGGNTNTLSILPNTPILGAPNSLRDPKSPNGFYGVFGNNPLLKTLRVGNFDLTRDVFIHGRFTRH
jgi:hypothetical protein